MPLTYQEKHSPAPSVDAQIKDVGLWVQFYCLFMCFSFITLPRKFPRGTLSSVFMFYGQFTLNVFFFFFTAAPKSQRL